MKRLILLFALIFLFLPSPTFAQIPQQAFLKGTVIKIEKEGTKDIGTSKNIFQTVRVKILEGEEKGKEITLEHGGMFTIQESQKVNLGDQVVITQTSTNGESTYTITDRYRLDKLLFILVGFFALVIGMAGRRGIGAVIGLIISILVITQFIVPQILSGSDPLFVSIVGSLFILVTTIYLAHGFSQKTTIAVGSTFISLVLTAIFATVFVSLAKLSGLGSEDAYSLAQGFNGIINFKGLLLGGIIIGALGVLDDVTTTQSAAVFALAAENAKLTTAQLFQRGFSIGKEHITSVVNTLVLAYAGASIGVFIFLILALQNNQPLWMIVNSEAIAEEVVRTLAGSIGLILAVPITTLLAAFFAKYSVSIK
ncbi:MAG TPA: YibE/F family protein [Patescibacteria group bacterium]|nr:YibE/F family protein [Patescibacteria group bacterium]